jgi:ribosomal protein S18 acetylase RimI-like enzyme
VQLRIARVEDAPMLAVLGAATFAQTFQADNSPENIRAYVAANFQTDIQARELADARVVVIVAECGGNAAGYVKLHWSEAPACVRGDSPIEIARIYVSAAYLGSGVGAALMSGCLERAAELGAKTIWLGVWERNARALSFYRRFGFVECGDHEFVVGSDRQRDILMARPIDVKGA